MTGDPVKFIYWPKNKERNKHSQLAKAVGYLQAWPIIHNGQQYDRTLINAYLFVFSSLYISHKPHMWFTLPVQVC